MAEFAIDLALSAYQRELAVRHFEQTYHMNFGAQERITANYFRVDPAECVDQSAPAVVLRALTEAVRGGGPVRLKLGSLGRGDRYRLSALLQQTAYRPDREGNSELASALMQLWQEFDRQARVTGDEFERAEHVLTGR